MEQADIIEKIFLFLDPKNGDFVNFMTVSKLHSEIGKYVLHRIPILHPYLFSYKCYGVSRWYIDDIILYETTKTSPEWISCIISKDGKKYLNNREYISLDNIVHVDEINDRISVTTSLNVDMKPIEIGQSEWSNRNKIIKEKFKKKLEETRYDGFLIETVKKYYCFTMNDILTKLDMTKIKLGEIYGDLIKYINIIMFFKSTDDAVKHYDFIIEDIENISQVTVEDSTIIYAKKKHLNHKLVSLMDVLLVRSASRKRN